MNVIVIMTDSLRRDHVGAYGKGSALAYTPSLDRLASQSVVFDRAYIASYPTIPNRLDLFTGRYNFPVRGWQPLEPQDKSLPEYLQGRGLTSMYVFDPPPLGNNEYNFMRGFDAWWWVRGHHQDRFITNPSIPTPLTAAPHKIRNVEALNLYLRNRAHWQYDRDYIGPQTLRSAMDWLEDNHSLEGFFLWVDVWHPHEPFDPPEHYLRLYEAPGYKGEHIIYPNYGRSRYLSEEELRHIRALYAGQVSLVDHWIGELLDKVEQLGLDKNTLVVHMTDHGHLFGEHGREGKPGAQLGSLYETTAHVPLMMRLPGAERAGQRVSALVQPPDVLPTLLEYLEVPVPENIHGRSLWPLIEGRADRVHDFAFSGRWAEPLSSMTLYAKSGQAFDGWAGSATATDPLTVTDERWALVCAPSGQASELFDLERDPAQLHNVLQSNPDVAARMHGALLSFLEHTDAKPERVAPFRDGPLSGKRGGPAIAYDTRLFLLRDRDDRLIAYASRAERDRNVAPEWGTKPAGESIFGDLAEREPDVLVYLEMQFYDLYDLTSEVAKRAAA